MAKPDPATPVEAAPLPPVATGRITLHYRGKYGAHGFDATGWPLPARNLDADEVRTLVRTKKAVQLLVDRGLYRVVLLPDEPDDLPDDEEPPAPPKG